MRGDNKLLTMSTVTSPTFTFSALLAELLDALLLLGNLLGKHGPQVGAGVAARERRDGAQFLERQSDRGRIIII